MKTVIIAILILVAGCVSPHKETELRDCIDDQVRLYGDICAESSSGYEEMTGSEAHFAGVECAVETIRGCLADP